MNGAGVTPGESEEGVHHSRLITVMIDCDEDDFETGANFWADALGRPRMERDDRYNSIRGRIGGEGGVIVALQRVPADERQVHLDIETDDVEAEVSRLESLGARVKDRIRGHVVMVAPSGHVFCVVPVTRRDFPAGATRWP